MAKSKENLEIKELEFDSEGMYVIDGTDPIENKTISTGSLGLDILTGGIGSGVVQLWGPDGIGKTTLLLIMGGEFQKFYNYKFVRVYLHATEGRINRKLEKMAPNLKMVTESEEDLTQDEKGKIIPAPIFRMSRPKSGEKLFNGILKTLKQDKVKFFHIIDSIDGIQSEVNDNKTFSDAEKTASTATLLTRFLKEASAYANHYGHIVAFTHQVRDKINQGGMSHVSGVGKQKAGGHAIDHYSNLRLGLEKLWTDLYIRENPSDNHSKVIGHIMSMKLEKVSNSGNVHSKASVPFIYDHGIDHEREIATLADGYGLIQKKGAWYALDDKNIAQGYNKLIEYLKSNKDIAERLEKEIKKMVGI